MRTFVVAFCTHNRAHRLPGLVAALRAQACSRAFDILAIDNHSTDRTAAVLRALAAAPGAPLRIVHEARVGIVPARNRAIAEALHYDAMQFIDDDELPQPDLLEAAQHAIFEEGADCAGGRVAVDFSQHPRPAWLSDELLGFLAALDYGDAPFWITDATTPVWTSNVAYAMRLFRNDASLRFDPRFNRVGHGIGGGEDGAMFQTLLSRGARIRYRPDMAVSHLVDAARLRRRYFLRLHYRAGVRHALYQMPAFPRTVAGVPPFLLQQWLSKTLKLVARQLSGERGLLREAMNAAHALGCIVGYARRRLPGSPGKAD